MPIGILNIIYSILWLNIARRNTFNAWLSANYSTYFDGIVDLSGSPEIFADDAPDDATYFNAADLDGNYKVHLTDAGADVLATKVADAITALSLTSSIPITPVDYAQEFIDAAGIADSTQISAIQTLVASLLTAGLWHKLAAIYPFVGGTPDTHKYNLRDPTDEDEAYRLIYNGTPTHDANGITFVSSSYANTGYVFRPDQAIIYSLGSSLSYYSRTASLSVEGVDMGVNTGCHMWLAIKLGGNTYCDIGSTTGDGVPVGYTATGLFTTTRNNDVNSSTLYRNGVSVLVRSTAFSYSPQPSYPMWIGGANNGGAHPYPSSRNCAYAAIGYGLTADDEAVHYTIIQAFQTTLGRAV